MPETIDFFSARRDPYYIAASDFRQNSAGIRALHYLCHTLNELGCEAYLSPATVSNPALNVRFLTRARLIDHYRAGRMPIAVYPEVVSGNPLRAPVIARWLLNRPGHLGGDTHYAAADLLFHFQEWCRPQGVVSHRLQLTPTDTHIFNNENNPFDDRRSGHCYYANKYLGSGARVPREIATGGISVGQEVRLSHEELADVFRRAAVLYCFEPSGIAQEALACGCPVLLVGSDYWNPAERPELVGHGVGIHGQPGALEKAQAELRQTPAGDFLRGEYRMGRDMIDDFVRLTQAASARRRGDRAPGPDVWAVAPRQRGDALAAFVAALPPRFLYGAGGDDEVLACTADSEVPPTAAGLAPPGGRPFEIFIVEEQPLDGALDASLRSLAAQPPALYRHLVVAPRAKPPTAPADLLWLASDDPWQSVSELLAAGDGEAWVGVLRSGNRLARHALPALALALAAHPEWQALVADECVDDPRSGLREPRPLPPPQADLLRGGHYAPGWLVARRSVWHAAGGWRYVPHRVDELDAALRLGEVAGREGFGHLPGFVHLRHPRHDPLPEFPDSGELRQLVVADHLRRSGEAATAEAGMFPGGVRVRYRPATLPRISLVVATRDNAAGLAALLASLDRHPANADSELIVVDNGSVEPAARQLIARLRGAGEPLRVLAHDAPWNLAAMFNAAAAVARGELLVFLHDDVEILHDGWLAELAAQCLRPGVAAAGPRLLARDGSLVDAGGVALRSGLAPPLFSGDAADTPGTAGLAASVREVSALGGACLMVRRDACLAVGGMDATHFPLRGAEVDFCLRLRAAGHRIVWTPYASLLHDTDNTTRCRADDNKALLARWARALLADPGFSPALALDGTRWRAEPEAQFACDPFAGLPVPKIFCLASPLPSPPERHFVTPARSAARAGLARARFWPSVPVPLLLARLGVETIVSHALLGADERQSLADCRALAGCRVVIDVDDMLARLPATDFAGTLAQLDGIADRYTTSSRNFCARFGDHLAGKLVCIPPLLAGPAPDTDATPQMPAAAITPAAPATRRPRVGWVGEAADLERIAAALCELQGEVDWVAVAPPPDLVKPCFAERYLPADGDERSRLLATLALDFAVLPLAGGGANDWLPPPALLEFAALGIPLLVSDVAGIPADFPAPRVADANRAWSAAVREWAGDPQRRAQAAAALRRHVAAEHRGETLLARWLAVWRGEA